LRYQDGRRAVSRTDDTDGSRVLNVESKDCREYDGKEDTKLGGSAKQEHLRIGKKGTEVDHRSNTDKQQERECFRSLNSGFKQPLHDTVRFSGAFHKLVQSAASGNVDQDRAKAHRKKKGRFVILLDREVDQ